MFEQSLATLMILTVNLLSNHRGNTSLVCIATHDEHRFSVGVDVNTSFRKQLITHQQALSPVLYYYQNKQVFYLKSTNHKTSQWPALAHNSFLQLDYTTSTALNVSHNKTCGLAKSNVCSCFSSRDWAIEAVWCN